MRSASWVGGLAGSMITAAACLATAPAASASAAGFCDQIGGQWNGQYCHAVVQSKRLGVREINIAIPGELDNPVMGKVIGDYLSTLMNNWRTASSRMVADSWGDANFETFQHGNLRTVVFHEDYHADGTALNNAYRTFTFDMASGRQLQLADVVDPAAVPALGAPFIEAALDQAPPPHDPGTYPFVADRWMPDKVYSGGYKAWALTPTELILYMPDYPVARDAPIDFTPGALLWSMDGGAVQPHIPLSALAPALRPGI